MPTLLDLFPATLRAEHSQSYRPPSPRWARNELVSRPAMGIYSRHVREVMYRVSPHKGEWYLSRTESAYDKLRGSNEAVNWRTVAMNWWQWDGRRWIEANDPTVI